MKPATRFDRARRDAEPECADVTRHLWPLLDGEVSARTAARLRAHLRRCEACREYVRYQRAFLRRVRTALRASRREPSSRGAH